MADVTLLNVNYTDVPAIELPKTGGGVADFIDVSDTTANNSDVAKGKYFYNSNGVRSLGTLALFPKGIFTIVAQFSYVKDGSNYHALWPLPFENDYSSVVCSVVSQVGVSSPVISTSDITARILSSNCIDIYTPVSNAAGKTFTFRINLS